MPVWGAQETKGVAYHSLMLPLPIPLSVSLAQVGKLAIITTTQGAMKRVIAAGLDGQASITSNPSYQQAKGSFAMRPQSILFAEPSVIAKEFPEVPGMGLLEGIKRMVFSGYLLPQGSRSIGRVDIDFPTFINGLDQAVLMASALGGMRGRGRQSPGVSSQQATCLSNEKQIALAMLMFADDHDGILPNADTWKDDLLPYIKNAKLLQCPSDISGAKCSYAMNAALSGKKSREIANPGQTVLLFESAKPGLVTSGRATDVATPPRHSGGNCFAFADGHAKCQKATPTF
jgi:prepilin-type processing-associated H-X9-DG protein